MIDVIVLNRNLGSVCDALCIDIESVLGLEVNIVVVDCSTSEELASKRVTVQADSEAALRDGLRFGRGMNLGINYLLDADSQSDWMLLLPVDTEIVHLGLEALVRDLNSVVELVAVKPMPESSAYEDLMPITDFALGWNFEEGPWLLKTGFVREQIAMSGRDEFFDANNFRGYLTSLELAFRAYANGLCVGTTKNLLLRENESYLIEKASLMKTNPLEENHRLFISEGVAWLQSKYGIADPWDFAQLVRLGFERFLVEHPDEAHISLGGASQ